MSCLKYYRPTVQLKRISNKFIIKEEKIMAMEITNNYNSYAAQGMAGNTKRRKQKKHRKRQKAVNPRIQQSTLMDWLNLFQV